MDHRAHPLVGAPRARRVDRASAAAGATSRILLFGTSAAIGLLGACAPGAPASAPRPEPPRPVPEEAPPELPPRPDAVAFAFGEGSNRYAVQLVSVVQVGGDSIPPGVDTVRVGGTVLLAISGGDSARSVAGTVYETSLEQGPLIRQPGPVPRAEPPASIDFAGEVMPGAVMLRLDQATTTPPSQRGDTILPDSTCPALAASKTTMLALARETLPVIPRTMAVGATWRDTVTMVTCRAGVSMTAESLHEYELLELRRGNGVHTARLRRSTIQSVLGSGVQSRLPVRVEGEGTGESEIWLDLTNGRLISHDGQSSTIMQHTAGDRRAIVEQTTTIQVRLQGNN